MSRPICNLYRDGWKESARFILRSVREWSRMHIVINPAGDLMGTRGMQRGANLELVGVYREGVTLDDIQDDLIDLMAERYDAALRKRA